MLSARLSTSFPLQPTAQHLSAVVLKRVRHHQASAITIGQRGAVDSALPISSSKEELPSSLLWFLSSRRERLFGFSPLPTARLAYTLLARGLYKNRGRAIIHPSQGESRHEHGARLEIMQTFGVRRDLPLLSTNLEQVHPVAKVNSKVLVPDWLLGSAELGMKSNMLTNDATSSEHCM